jgi:glycosyltransferase involved in cell wall biosynthesis
MSTDIVHTHTAKAGMLGRTAALLARGRRPIIIVHTFHGHVLEGYFGRLQTLMYRAIERWLARFTTCLIGVSQATLDDLVRLRIAPRSKFRFIPVGLDLARFLSTSDEDGLAFRQEVGAGPEDVVFTYAGRLVPIKRIDVMLRAFASAWADCAAIRLAIVGDGSLRQELEGLSQSLGIRDRVHFLGYRRELEAVIAGTDVAIVSSDNEGTPVFLIEAAAGGRPAIATSVGGVPEVVTSQTGVLVQRGNERDLAVAMRRLAIGGALRTTMGGRAREHVRDRFASARLIRDVERLYNELQAPNAVGKASTRIEPLDLRSTGAR